MNKIVRVVGIILPFLFLGSPVLAASTTADISSFTNSTLSIITLIASVASVFFLIKGGYHYITSTGHPEAIEEAKHTIRNALIGLVIVLGASVIVSLFQGALTSETNTTTVQQINLSAIQTISPQPGLTQVIIDAVTGFFQNIVESATKPIVDGILSLLVSTPELLGNSVIFNFWLVSLGIVDSLFVIVVAFLGLNIMSASTFGFDELEFKHLLPRIGLAFLGANVSLFLANYVIITSNALVNAVLHATGGLNHAWIMNTLSLPTIMTNNVPLVTIIFLVIFVIIAILLLFMYITRLIIISLGAVLSPFIFLLWAIPKFSDAAEMAAKTYIVSVFVVFVHVVTIQLAASFLSFPDSNTNSLLGVAIAIGLFLTLVKIPQFMMQIMVFSSGARSFKKIGGQIINVMSSNAGQATATRASAGEAVAKIQRKVVDI